MLWADWLCCLQRVFLDQRRTLKDGRDLDHWRDVGTVFRGTGSRVRETFIQILALLLPSNMTLHRLPNQLSLCFYQ